MGTGGMDALAPPSDAAAKAAASLMLDVPAGGADTTPLADPSDLPAVLRMLTMSERYTEAVACQAHLSSADELKARMADYEQAKEDDDLETAMHLKKTVLPGLKAQVASDETVQSWARAAPSVRTLGQMASVAQQAMGAEHAGPFVTKCCSANLGALASSGQLAEAARLHAVASGAFRLLAELLPVERQTSTLQRMTKALEAVKAHLRGAASALDAKPIDEANASTAPEVLGLLQGMVALQTLGARLAASIEWHAAIFAPAAKVGGAGAIVAVQVKAELASLVRGAHAAVGVPAPAVADEEVAEYWAAAVPLSERCALSLLPLRSDAQAGLPPTVEWQGEKMHAPCANLVARMGGEKM